MRTILFLSALTLVMTGCNYNNHKQDLDIIKGMESKFQIGNSSLKSVSAQKGELLHIVFFKVKSEKIDSLILILKELEKSHYVNAFLLGKYKELNDPRALKEYDVMMQINFVDTLSYRKYQQDKIHLKVKRKTKSFLSEPPLTYDAQLE